MNERNPNEVYAINSPEAIRAAKAHEIVLEEAFEELASCAVFPYHNPAHTYGETLDGKTGGVLGITRQLLQVINAHTTELGIKDQSAADTMLAQQLGAEAGAAYHDTVMQITGVTNEENPLLRKVQRAGGWESGCNEYESFEILKYFAREYIADGQFRDAYLTAAEAAIMATVPNASFTELPADHVEQYSDIVQSILRSDDGVYRGLLIEPAKPPTTLSGLVLTTADLSAVRSPEIFYRTGNAEFWELHYKLADCAADCLQGEIPIKRADAKTLLEEMNKWRRTQVGFAVAQRVRLEETITLAAIQTAAAAEAYPAIGETEAAGIANAMKKQLAPGMDASIEDSAQRYEAFSETFSISAEGADTLTDEELQQIQVAIVALGGTVSELRAYVAKVEQDLQDLNTKN